MRFAHRFLSTSAAVALALAVSACGGVSGSTDTPGVGTISITAFAPNPIPAGLPVPFVITGLNFATTTGNTAIVRFHATNGTPFGAGTLDTAEVEGRVTSDTTIDGTTPVMLICGVASVTLEITVILESGVQTTFTGGGIPITASAPTVTSVVSTFGGNVVPSLVPTAITINGTNFAPPAGPFGGTATIRLTGDTGAHCFADGTENTATIYGTITSDTTIAATSPVCTNPVTGGGFAALSTALQGAAVEVTIDASLSCSTGVGTPGAILFDRPDGTTAISGTSGPQVATQTIAHPFTITSVAPPTNVFAPNGAATCDVTFVASSGTPFGGGTSQTGTVTGFFNAGTVVGTTPLAVAAANFTATVNVVFESGMVGSGDSGLPITFVAPPVIASVTNDETAPNLPRGVAGPVRTFSAASFSPMRITGANFQAGATTLVYDQAVGTTKPIGGGTLQNLISVPTVTPTAITGDSPVDPSQSTTLQAGVRVTNPDGQVGEFTAATLVFTPRIDFLDRNLTAETGTNSEASIAINPTNPLRMVAFQHTFVGGIEGRLSRSLDGGRTWTQTRIDGATAGGDGLAAVNRVDPRCAYDRFGNLYVVYFAVPQAGYPGTPPRNMVCVRSTDDGATFSSTIVATDPGTSMDRDFVAVGVDGSNPAREAIYVGWRDGGAFGGPGDKIVVAGATSTGLGAFSAFGPPVPVTDTPTRLHQLAYGAVGGNGDFYVCWYDYTGAPGAGLPALSIVMDRDPGGMFAPPSFGADMLVSGVGQGFFELPPSDPTRGTGPNPEMTVARGGPFPGRANLVWSDEVPPSVVTGNLDIESTFTDTGGLTFHSINSPSDFSGGDQFMASVQVDRASGALYATWYDSRASIANAAVRRFATASYDGGATWLANLQLSDAFSSPSGDGFDWGDYQGMDVTGGCGFAVFADTSNSTGTNVGGSTENYVSRFQIK